MWRIAVSRRNSKAAVSRRDGRSARRNSVTRFSDEQLYENWMNM
jgi:hypothetical protein